MTTCSEIAQTAEPAASWPHKAATALKTAWSAYWERRARQATVTLLQSLDAPTLRDIGINRSEIESVVYGPPLERRQQRWTDTWE
jgi:uncharacterized protein YjiS (DUF1127 family)